MTRFLALILASVLFAVAPVRILGSEVPTCALPDPAPEGSARLRWKGPGQGEGEGSAGTWVSDAAMQRAAERLNTAIVDSAACRDLYSTCRADLTFEKAKVRAPSWWIWVGGVGAAFAGGFLLARSY